MLERIDSRITDDRTTGELPRWPTEQAAAARICAAEIMCEPLPPRRLMRLTRRGGRSSSKPLGLSLQLQSWKPVAVTAVAVVPAPVVRLTAVVVWKSIP